MIRCLDGNEFRLLPWDDDPTEPACDPLGIYAETYWLPALYPATYLVARRLVINWNRHAARSGPDDKLIIEIDGFAEALALTTTKRRQAFDRCIDRLVHRRLARFRGDTILEFKVLWPRITSTRLAALSPKMQQAEPDIWMHHGIVRATNLLTL